MMDINILVTIDKNYCEQLITMLRSLAASSSDRFCVYIAHSTLSFRELAHIKKEVGCERVSLFPVKLSPELFAGARFSKRISRETYYRLLMFEYLPAGVERVLYLDPDIIVLNSVRLFYSLDLGKGFIAGAGHTHGAVKAFNRLRLRLGRKGEYINAGVLLVDVAKMRAAVTSEQIFSFVSRRGRSLLQADQDVINALFKNSIVSVNPCFYNLDESTFKRNGLTLDWVQSKAVFVHYNGKNKPWLKSYRGSLGVFWKRFEPHASQTERRARDAS